MVADHLAFPPLLAVVSAGAVAGRVADERAGRSPRGRCQGICTAHSCIWPWLGGVHPQAGGLPRTC
jgi:hypothetical protein